MTAPTLTLTLYLSALVFSSELFPREGGGGTTDAATQPSHRPLHRSSSEGELRRRTNPNPDRTADPNPDRDADPDPSH